MNPIVEAAKTLEQLVLAIQKLSDLSLESAKKLKVLDAELKRVNQENLELRESLARVSQFGGLQ